MAAPTPLADLALLTLVVAHGMDADLDPRESREVVRQLEQVAVEVDDEISGADLSDLVEAAVREYGRLSVVGLDAVVIRLRDALAPVPLARAHAALVGVTAADGVMHTMEETVLRHIGQAWGLE